VVSVVILNAGIFTWPGQFVERLLHARHS
jgi:hypothetical protein